MATTNFLLFDPGYVNAETDAQYNADASRSGGFSQDSIVTSAILNKILIQNSQMVVALATMLKNKGITTSDANQSGLVSALSNILTTADQRVGLSQMPFSPTATFNLAGSAAFFMILTDNLSNPTFTGVTSGTQVTFTWQQGAAGGYTIAWTNQFYGPGPAQPDPTPGTVSAQTFMVYTDGILRPISPMVVTTD